MWQEGLRQAIAALQRGVEEKERQVRDAEQDLLELRAEVKAGALAVSTACGGEERAWVKGGADARMVKALETTIAELEATVTSLLMHKSDLTERLQLLEQSESL